MSTANDIEWVKYHKTPPLVNILEGTPFYTGVLNMVYGLSKSGKSRSLAELLVQANIHNGDKTVVWLDKDYNVDDELIKLLSNFKHANDDIDALCEKLLSMKSLKDYIIIFDSLKDFSKHGLDSNADAQESMEYIREFTKLGATVIVIVHATKWISSDYKKSGFKVQGNSETIQSKCDCIFRFKLTDTNVKLADDNKVKIKVREFIPERMRISNASTETVSLYDGKDLAYCIHHFINTQDGMTRRDLSRKFSDNIRSTVLSLENIAYCCKEEGQKNVVYKIESKCPP